MNELPIYQISDATLPKPLAQAEIRCAFCPRSQKGQAWLKAGFECNCSDSANVLQTFRADANGNLESYRVREFWNIYEAAQEATQRRLASKTSQWSRTREKLEQLLQRVVPLIAPLLQLSEPTPQVSK